MITWDGILWKDNFTNYNADSTLGYTNFCKKCRGFTPKNIEKIMPALQVN